MKRFCSASWLALLLCFLAFACDHEGTTESPSPVDPVNVGDSIVSPTDTAQAVVLDSSAVYITFSGEETVVTNAFPSEVLVSCEGSHVSIVSAIEINFVLRGQSANASVTVSSDSDVYVVLDSVFLSNSAGYAPLRLQGKARNIVYLSEGTENGLADNNVSDDDVKGCIYSDSTLILTGEGSLSLTSVAAHAVSCKGPVYVQSGNYVLTAAKDGIHAGQSVVITGGSLNIHAADDACQSELSYIQMTDGRLTAESEAEKANVFDAAGNIYIQDGTLTATLSGNAAKALKTDASMLLSGGTVTLSLSGDGMYDPAEYDVTACVGLKTGGNLVLSGTSLTMTLSGSGAKGIKTGGSLYLQDGQLTIYTYGDKYEYSETLTSASKAVKVGAHAFVSGGVLQALSSTSDALDCDSSFYLLGGFCTLTADGDAVTAMNITVSGGEIYAYSQTNDGLDGTNGITVSGGKVLAIGSAVEKKGGFETDGVLRITGGSVLAVGNKNSKPTSYSNSQNAFSYAVSQDVGRAERFTLVNADGDVLMSYAVPRTYTLAFNLVYSDPSLTTGSDYNLYQGGTVTDADSWNDWGIGGSYTPGTLIKTFTQSSVLVKL